MASSLPEFDGSEPQMLGRYALYAKIASGGMASVHVGRLLGPVGFSRTVAIKRMHPQLSEDPAFVSMFLDEARLAARIRHPNVVPTLDVVAMTGELFLVMEFVQGESLSRLIRLAATKGERIPPAMAATIMAGVLHGLHAAHEATSETGQPLGIVHRDVSPQNVLVGVDGVPRVLDFGVAKAAGRMQSTREGQLKGKLAYMSPEQVNGHTSRSADVYAASVVLWEALTGKGLFRADSEAAVLAQVIKGCTTPPSARVPGLPQVLDYVTMRGLSVDPTARFATAREMAQALEDAVPLVAASKIGDWVQALASVPLAERSALVASIESNSRSYGGKEAPARAGGLKATQPMPPMPPRASLGPDVHAVLPSMSPEASASHLVAGHSNTSVSSNIVAPRPARRVGWAMAAGVVLLLSMAGLSLAGLAHWARPSPTTTRASAASSTPIAPRPTAIAATEAALPSPPPALSADPVVSADSVAPVPTAPSKTPAHTVPRPAATPRPTPLATTTSAATPHPECRVVTNYDSDGQPHFTKVCP